MTGLLDVARQAEQAQLARDASMSRHGLLNNDNPIQRAMRGGSMYGSLMQDPADKARMDRQMLESTLAMMPMGGMTQAGRWFHGTPHTTPITKFREYNPTSGDPEAINKFSIEQLNTLIGPHVAKDTNIANKFGMGLYKGMNAMEGGQVMPMSISGKSRTIPQPKYSHGEFMTDQHAIHTDMAKTVFPQQKDLFVQWAKRAKNLTDGKANKLWDDLKSGNKALEYGEGAVKDRRKYKDAGEYVADFDSNLWHLPINEKWKVIDLYKKDMKAKGYTSLEYQNTAQREVGEELFDAVTGQKFLESIGIKPSPLARSFSIPKAEDATSRIILDQNAITPSFGRGLLGK